MRKITGEQQSLFDTPGSGVPAGPGQDDAEVRLEALRDTTLQCSHCVLRSGCSRVVFGEGNPRARLMLVGEGPGSDEDRLGRPFVGRAGQLLDRILTAARIEREEVYITNVVKCRPPSNRLPVQQEVDSCRPFLVEQIELINPEILICLGALATRTLIDRKAAITRIRGQWHEIDGRQVIATFHPAALLRDPAKKVPVWEDFKEVMKLYNNDQGG